jgi:thiamine pyrophosphate-dependent acetolactate synthase large subunit-like protein
VSRAVEQEGVTDVFGLMGEGNMHFMAHVAATGVRLRHVRHEASAVSMADGYARARNDVGVATVTCGPGVTQLGTALAVANRHRSPIVVVGGDLPARAKGAGTSSQDIDQQAFVVASGALFCQLRSVSSAFDDTSRAFWLARERRQPVFLNCPIDVIEAEALGLTTYARRSPTSVAVAEADPDAVEKAVDMLASARRPVLVAGAGAVAAGAIEVIDALGERVGAALATTLRAKGSLDGPWSIGICGSLASPAAEDVLAAADVVVLIGASGDPHTAAAIPAGCRTLQINVDPYARIGTRPADLSVLGDARAVLEDINGTLSKGDFSSSGYREGSFVPHFHRSSADDDIEEASWDPEPGVVDPRAFIRDVDAVLPKACRVVIGAGHFWSVPASHLHGYRSRTFDYTLDFGCIGQALPTAIGVALADPTRPVVVFEGDGSVLMHIQELDTATRYGAQLLVFVMNDGALGAEYHKLGRSGFDPELGRHPSPSFEDVAKGFGASGGTITSLDDIAGEVQAFASSAGPRLVDVRIQTDVVSRSYRTSMGYSATKR